MRLSEKLLTTREVAEYLRVTTRAVTGWAKDGRIKATRAGKGWRFTEQAVKEFQERSAGGHAANDNPQR